MGARRRQGMSVVETLARGLVGPIFLAVLLISVRTELKPADIAAALGRFLLAAAFVIAGVGLGTLGLRTIIRGHRAGVPDADLPADGGTTPRLPNPVQSPRSPSPSAYPPSARPISGFDWKQTLDELDWFQFEKLVAAALACQGRQVERRGGANADGGIDLVARRSGEPDLAVQCKHWRAWNLGVARVREFLGAMTHAGFTKGLLIASKGYTAQAADLARQHGIALMDQAALIRLLEAAGCRFAPEVQALLSDKTKYCPRCEAPMILRQGTTPFWGCSRYPACRYTMPVDRP